MLDSKLQKEFKESDVQRLRNIVSKKTGDKTTTQVGYIKDKVDHVEGDIWEENSRKWTIKNGIKQTITRFDDLKKVFQIPLVCPKCSKPMNKGHIDKQMFYVHKVCFDCVIDHETELKRLGKFEEYQTNMNKQSILVHIQELEQVLLELALGETPDKFVTEQGDIEDWKGAIVDNSTLMEDIKIYIIKLKEAIK